MAPTTPETAKAAADMKKSDVKDFASTKHKKLPEKKVAKEAADFSQRDKILKKAKPLHKHLFKNLHKGDRKGDVNEESNPRIPRKKGQPANSKKHSDLYTDENPKGTIHGLDSKMLLLLKHLFLKFAIHQDLMLTKSRQQLLWNREQEKWARLQKQRSIESSSTR